MYAMPTGRPATPPTLVLHRPRDSGPALPHALRVDMLAPSAPRLAHYVSGVNSTIMNANIQSRREIGR